MGKVEDAILEVLDWRRKNYILMNVIETKLGNNTDITKHKLQEIMALREGIRNNVSRGAGIIGYIKSLKEHNRRLQVKKIRTFQKLL